MVVVGIVAIVGLVFGSGWVANDVAHKGIDIGPVKVAPVTD